MSKPRIYTLCSNYNLQSETSLAPNSSKTNLWAQFILLSPDKHQLLAVTGIVAPTVGLVVVPLRGSEELGHVPTGQTSPPPRGGVTHNSAVIPCVLNPSTDE